MASGHLRKMPQKDGTNKWQITIEVRTDPITGKRERIYKTVRATKKEADRIMRAMLDEVEGNTFVQDMNLTLGEFLKEWFEVYIIPMKSPTTTIYYRLNVFRYLIPNLGHIKVQKLTVTDIQKFYNRLLLKSTLSDDPLSPKTVRNIHMNLQAALNQAVKLGLVSKNVAKDVQLLKCKRYAGEVYSKEELDKLFEVARGTDLELAIILLACLGLRRGELLALTWDDIDFENAKIHINKSLVNLGKDTLVKEPKTPSSVRTLDIPRPLLEMLRKEKLNYAREKLRLGRDFIDKGFVFHMGNGKNYHPNTVTHKFQLLLKRNNLKRIRLHDLRHTNATLMLAFGISPKVAQKRLGHSNFSTTMDIYSHVLDEVNKEASDIIEANIFKNK